MTSRSTVEGGRQQVAALLTGGADPKLADPHGLQPIHIAAGLGLRAEVARSEGSAWATVLVASVFFCIIYGKCSCILSSML